MGVNWIGEGVRGEDLYKGEVRKRPRARTFMENRKIFREKIILVIN